MGVAVTQVDQRRSRSAAIRDELGYPVIDGDGHVVELLRVFIDYRTTVATAISSTRRRRDSSGARSSKKPG